MARVKTPLIPLCEKGETWEGDYFTDLSFDRLRMSGFEFFQLICSFYRFRAVFAKGGDGRVEIILPYSLLTKEGDRLDQGGIF
jgi:hypothetical protein